MFLLKALIAITIFAVTSFAGVAFAVEIRTLFSTGTELGFGGRDERVTVSGPGITTPINPIGVPPVRFTTPSANDWAFFRPGGALLPGAWITPFASPPSAQPSFINCPGPTCAAHAPEGAYVYRFGIPVVPTGSTPTQLHFTFFADNMVSDVRLTADNQVLTGNLCSPLFCPPGRNTQNIIGSAGFGGVLPLSTQLEIDALVTVVNTNGAEFNPTGLNLRVEQEFIEVPTAAPEPSTLPLLAMGSLSWFLYTRLKKLPSNAA